MATKTRKSVGKRLKARKHRHSKSFRHWLKSRSRWQRVGLSILALLILCIAGMYAIGQWYIAKHKSEPLQIGMTFVPKYARYYGLDPEETMQAMVDDLGVKRFRLVSYWDEGEPTPGTYDFTDLDWQMEKAEANDAKVSLAIGLRQPRWPECHMPKWAIGQSTSEWSPALNKYIEAVVQRYKDSPALDSYQLENEYFLNVFGECTDFSRDRLVSEYNLVKSLDPDHPLIVSMSNNAIGTPIGNPKPDMFAISVYKRVWDKTITKRYFEYPLPAWYYAFRAGWVELTTGKNSFIHELQAEAWLPDNRGFKMNEVSSIDEQNKSLNPERLTDRIEYGRATGMRTFDLWGGEWWYWRKVKAGDSTLWDTARDEITKLQTVDSLER